MFHDKIRFDLTDRLVVFLELLVNRFLPELDIYKLLLQQFCLHIVVTQPILPLVHHKIRQAISHILPILSYIYDWCQYVHFFPEIAAHF